MEIIGVVCIMRPNAGADTKPDGAGVYAAEKIHLYHYDLPLALISPDDTVAWRAEYDEWGNQLSEDNPAQLEQLIRLPGQQYDDESGLYYNRHRYYSPGQGRYITQDPIGLAGGWNPYIYPLNPVSFVDFLGLQSNPLDQDEELNNREYGGYQENQCCSFLSLHDRDINVKIYDLMPFPGVAMKGPRTEWLDRKLPSDKYGNIIPDKDIPHTQLGMRIGRRKTYMQAREWGYDEQGKLIPKRLIDFTDHGRNDHTNPHQHTYEPNSTGGTWRHGKQCEVE
ncbi:Protein rhsA [Salmonella enterica subsp. salamae]|nr:Protein rhsA [Salmonella enterica subsp. salamae]